MALFNFNQNNKKEDRKFGIFSALSTLINPVKAVTKAAVKVGTSQKTKEIVKEVARSIPRAGVSVINTLNQARTGREQTYVPPTGNSVINRIERSIIGNKNIGDTTDYGRQFTKDIGLETDNRLITAPLGVALAVSDAFTGGGASKAPRALKAIALESKSLKNVLKNLNTFRLTDDIKKEIAPVLLKINDPGGIALLIKNAEVVSEVEKRTGQKVPMAIRAKIGQGLRDAPIEDPKQFQKFVTEMTEYVVKGAPKVEKPYSAQNLSKVAVNSLQKLPEEGRVIDEAVQEAKTGKAANGEYLKERILFKTNDKGELVVEDGKKLLEAYRKEGIEIPKDKVRFVDPESEKIFNKTLKEQEKQAATLIKKVEKVESNQAKNLSRPVKKVTPKPKSKKVVTNEKTALKNKLRIEQTAARRGANSARKETRKTERQAARENVQKIYTEFRDKKRTAKDFRNAVRMYVKDLPKNMQARILSKKKFSEIKNSKDLTKVLKTADKTRNAVRGEISRRKVLKEVKSLQTLLKQKGLTSRTNRNILKKFGKTRKDKEGNLILKKDGTPKLFMNREILKRLPEDRLSEIKNMLSSNLNKPTRTLEKDYSKAAPKKSSSKILEATGELFKKNLGIFSSNVRDFDRRLMYVLRKREEDIIESANKYADTIEGFSKKLNKLNRRFFGNKSDFNTFSAAVGSQDFTTARAIAKKHGFSEEFESVVKMLDEIHDNLKKSGVKVGKLPDFFPRSLNSYDEYYKAYTEKYGKKGVDYFNKIVKEASDAKYGANLTDGEKFDIITNAIRGYGNKLNSGGGKFQKSRKVDVIDPEFMKFYLPPVEALTSYVSRATKEMHTAGLFKKYGKDGVKQADAESIGALVSSMEGLSPKAARRLQELLTKALITPPGENALLSAARQSIYLTTLTHVTTILTQLADPALYLRKGGGPLSYMTSFFQKKPFKNAELFGNKMVEMSGSQMTNRMLTGLTVMDKTLGNAGIKKLFKDYTNAAKKGKGYMYRDLEDKLKYMFNNDAQRAKTISDLKNKIISPETRTFIFNEISDIQPRTILEMPEEYVANANKRIFYTLKTWQIKTWDVYRNEVFRDAKKNPMKSAWNFARLTGFLVLCGATSSQIKAYWSGKDESFSDSVINNALNLAMLSKFDDKTVSEDGLYNALVSKATPALGWINDVSSDIRNAGDGKGLKSVRDIPVIGKEIYNRAGRGAKNIEKANKEAPNGTSNKSLAKAVASGKVTTEQKAALIKMKEDNPSSYTLVKKYVKWEKLGLTEKEKSLASLSVSEGERAKAIFKMLKKSDNPTLEYKKLKSAGIISDDVAKQIKYLMAQ